MADQLLVLTHEYPPRKGGIATYVAETAQAAARLGWSTTVLAPRDSAPSDEGGLRVVPVPVRGTQGWPDRWRMRRAVKALDLDWGRTVLWLPEPGPIRLWLYADSLALPRPARLVLTLHGSEILRFARSRRRLVRFQRLLEWADAVGVVSKAVEQRLRKVAEVPSGRERLVPGAVQSGLAALLDPTAPPAPGPPWHLLTVGRIHPRKGQLDVVEALGLLPQRLRSQIIYRLIGPVRRPRYLARLQERARALGVTVEGPTVLPDAAALAQAYRDSHAMVLASRETPRSVEGFGLVYLEAAAAGRPVVATAAGGAREAVDPANGWVVPPYDPEALTETLRALLQDPAEAARRAAAGPAWAARFSWETVVNRLFGEPSRPSSASRG